MSLLSRLSIEISESQHQQIKAKAALQGLSIKDFILARTLSPDDSYKAQLEAEGLSRLKALLAPRVAAAESCEISHRSISEIAAMARSRREG